MKYEFVCHIHIPNVVDRLVIDKMSNVAQLSIYAVGSEVLGLH